VANLIDAIATSVWVGSNIASELNPLMGGMIEISLSLFLVVKLLIVNLSIYVLWRFKDRVLSKILILPVFVIYVYIVILHCYIFLNVLGPWRHVI